VSDKELAEILDRIFDDGEAELRCRLQDAREFKRDYNRTSPEMIVSIRREGQTQPVYLCKSFLKPDERARLRRRAIRSMAHFAAIVMELERTDPQQFLFERDDFEVVVESVLRKAVEEIARSGLKSA
jgi:hypothetical protein